MPPRTDSRDCRFSPGAGPGARRSPVPHPPDAKGSPGDTQTGAEPLEAGGAGQVLLARIAGDLGAAARSRPRGRRQRGRSRRHARRGPAGRPAMVREVAGPRVRRMRRPAGSASVPRPGAGRARRPLKSICVTLRPRRRASIGWCSSLSIPPSRPKPGDTGINALGEEVPGPAGQYDLVLLEPGPDRKCAAGNSRLQQGSSPVSESVFRGCSRPPARAYVRPRREGPREGRVSTGGEALPVGGPGRQHRMTDAAGNVEHAGG